MKVGVIVPMETNPARGTVVRYAETRAFALQAEAAGFDSIWVYDHLLYRYPDQPTGGIWEAWTTLSALAEATTRVELGVLVLCVPFRNPAVLAKMAATLEEVSAGRLILGLGAGWHQPEFDAFGLPFDHRVDRFEEALRIIVPLLRQGQVSVDGIYYRAVDCAIVPPGPRPGGPPILIGATRPRMLRLTARYADMWNTAWLGESTALAERRGPLEAACAAEGRDPATLAVTVGVGVDYDPTARSAETQANPATALTGSAEAVAAGLHGYARAGVAHVICALDPATPEALAHLGDALAIYRGLSGA